MKTIETLAIEFIQARDARTAAKNARNSVKCTEECAGDPETGQGSCAPCYASDPDNGKCEACERRDELHKLVAPLSKAATASYRKLRAAVHFQNEHPHPLQ